MAVNSDYNSIAMLCKFRDPPDFTGLSFLTPPDRAHMIEGKIIKNTKIGFKYLSTGYAPGCWGFEALTIKNFRERHGRIVVDGRKITRSVNTIEALYEWFNS